jgi:uncharacterized protein (DUF58 family)
VSEPRAADAPARKLLEADDVFGIASLEVRARAIAEGVLVGHHRSRRFGSSTEFAEHKLYSPGDELRHLDWKAYARNDRYFVRRWEEEASLDIHLVVDASGSMGYGGGARGAYHHSKLDYACSLAAAIGWLAARRSDGVGLSVFARDEVASLQPRARRDHLAEVFKLLEGARADGVTDLFGVTEKVGARMSRNALVVVFTDLLDVGADALAPLSVLRRRGADVLVLHTLDDDELDFPFDGVVRFVDMEGDREVQVDAPGVRGAYLEELQAFLDEAQRDAASRDLRYALARTSEAPAAVLRRALPVSALTGGQR